MGGFFIQDLIGDGVRAAPIYVDKHLVVTRTNQPEGLRLAGEIDITNSDAVGHSLRQAFDDAENPHLDLSRLSFCDISGIRALVDAARDLDRGRRLLLHGLPAQLEAVMRATGWSDLPSLALCECGGVAT